MICLKQLVHSRELVKACQQGQAIFSAPENDKNRTAMHTKSEAAPSNPETRQVSRPGTASFRIPISLYSGGLEEQIYLSGCRRITMDLDPV